MSEVDKIMKDLNKWHKIELYGTIAIIVGWGLIFSVAALVLI